MSTSYSPEEYITELVQSMTQVSAEQFFTDVHHLFYSDVDIHFMSKLYKYKDNQERYPVQQSELIDTGVINGDYNIREQLVMLGLDECKDFVSKDGEHYSITIEAYKNCIHYDDDYIEYYIMVEAIMFMYMKYRQMCDREVGF